MVKVERLLFAFTGVDGSGKSTLAKTLLERLASENVDVEYVWWFSAEGSTLGKIAGSVVRRIESSFEAEGANPSKTGLARRLYQFAVLADYLWRVWYSRALGKNLVCDRYVYDIAVFFATELHYSEARTRRLSTVLRRVAPRPHITFLVDVPADIAMQRKHDIPSSAPHEELRRLYCALTRGDTKIMYLDGTGSLEELNSTIWALVRDCVEEHCP
jgi:thymidylate kinase